ncbi:MAG: ATP-binding cassette domain-containing protein [Bacteroidales bacterium]|nr:ATP-binding cassette domain-containing protein [Bacteroidales bacterium]
MNILLSLESPTLRYVGVTLSNPYRVDLPKGITAIIGPNGAGKTTLGKIIEKGWNFMTNRLTSPSGARPKVKSIEFNDIHSLTGLKVEYYQQRYEAAMNDDVPTVASLFGEKINSDVWREMSPKLHLQDILDKRLNFLSSGELRKLLVVNMLFDLPEVLILDNPYIGLDAPSRKVLDQAIAMIASQGVSVVMLLCNPVDIPQMADAVLPMTHLTIQRLITREMYPTIEDLRHAIGHLFDYAINIQAIPRPQQKVVKEEGETSDEIFALRGCRVCYGRYELLRDVNWRVKRGECWALAGPNGSGKSTLLSLIHADNPQAYSNDITLFGRRRGSGESIWDIKRRIGYVSAEMHLYFSGGNNTVIDVIGAGLNDTVGCFRRITPQQRQRAERWVDLLHLTPLAQRRFNTLSAGEQRLVLLARTFIKNPELLILDEPLHGLDAARKRAIRAIVNTLASRDGATLIYVTHYLPEVPECVRFTKTLNRN